MTPSIRDDGAPVASAAPAPRAKRWFRILLTIAVCAAAWVWLARHANFTALAEQAGRLPAWAWVAAACGLLGGHGMRAVRLQREWRHLGHVPWRQCLRIVLTHNALVLLLPLRTGEAGYLWGVRQQWGVGWRAAGLGLLRWRLQDASVLAVLAAALLVPVPVSMRLMLVVAGAIVLHFVLPPLWSWLVKRHGDGQSGVPAGGGFWAGLPASTANWCLKVLANGGLLCALAGLPVLTALRAALGGELAGVQPLQPPAGLGTYEAGVWLAAHLPQMQIQTVVSAAVAVHAFSLAVALVSAGVMQLLLPATASLSQEPCP
jgi:uncharacterized membrane protein YbhN (UPF0104 family)